MVLRRLVELLAPTCCLGCGREGAVLCAACAELEAVRLPSCFRCRRLSEFGRTCGGCRPRTELAGVAVGATYGGAVKELILQLKFHRLRAAAGVAAELVLAALPEELAADMVSDVPVAPVRYRERGYNQSALVAREVARRLGLPYAPLLGRVTSVHQTGLGRQQRFEQIKGAFYPLRMLEGQRVLMLDDVITTGATLSECAATLTAAGAGGVWGAAVARR